MSKAPSHQFRISDRDIRVALHHELELRHQNDPDTRIIHELGLMKGSVRVDVAVVNGWLMGFEIKSDQDTLARLPNQEAGYSKVFDFVTLVGSEKFSEKMASLVPNWWGLKVAKGTLEGVILSDAREPTRNPNVDPSSVVQLLWKDETLALLERLGIAQGLRSKPRHYLWDALTANLSADIIRQTVRETLKAREDWLSRSQQVPGDDSSRPASK